MFSSCYTPIPTHRHVTVPQNEAFQSEEANVVSANHTNRVQFTPIQYSNETTVPSTPSAPPPTPARSNFPITDALSTSVTDLTRSLVDIEHSQARAHTRTTSITSNASYDEGYQAEVESVTPRSRSVSFSSDAGGLYDSDSSQQTISSRSRSISVSGANSQGEHESPAPRSGNMSIASLDSTQTDSEYMPSRSRSISISSATSYEIDSSQGEDHIDTRSRSASISCAASDEESSNLVVGYLQKVYPRLNGEQLTELEQLVERSTTEPENWNHPLDYLGKLATFGALNEGGRNANTGGV